MGSEDEVEQSVKRAGSVEFQPSRYTQSDELTPPIVPDGTSMLKLIYAPNRQAMAGRALQRNSELSIHIRCRMTASLRATATVAFGKPRRCATRMPQALRLDHRCVCVSNVWAASYSVARISASPHREMRPV